MTLSVTNSRATEMMVPTELRIPFRTHTRIRS